MVIHEKGKTILNILYIYDVEDWAIHEVGKLWLGNLTGHKVTFKKAKDVTKQDIDKSDFVWYGFARLYFMTFQANLDKSIIAVHDPNNIFSTQKFWRSSPVPLSLNYEVWYDFFSRFFIRRNNLKLIKKAKHVVVIS